MIGAIAFRHPELLAAAIAILALGVISRLVMRADAHRNALEANAPGDSGARRSRVPMAGITIAAGLLLLAGGAIELRARDRLVLTPIAGTIALALAFTIWSYIPVPSGLSRMRASACAASRFVAWTAAMIIVAAPAWQSRQADWERPLLLLLLDGSRSMGIADDAEGAPFASQTTAATATESRAERANRALTENANRLDRLRELFDVRMVRVGQAATPLSEPRVDPSAPSTHLAGALRQAAEARGAGGEPPGVVVLVSDGAENVTDAASVANAASDLAALATVVFAIGVGPPPEATRLVRMDPLNLPQRIGRRDELTLWAVGRVQPCDGCEVLLELFWDDVPVGLRRVRAASPNGRWREKFTLFPPASGAHRVTLRATLASLPGAAWAEESAMIEVRDDRIRATYVVGRPHAELGFVSRALRGDPSIELTILDDPESPGAASRATDSPWAGADVVILGAGSHALLTLSSVDALREAVTTRGVGLWVAGDADFYSADAPALSELNELLPFRGLRERPDGPVPIALRVAPDAAAHPVVQELLHPADSDPQHAAPPPATVYSSVRADRFAPLAQPLLLGADGEPMLIAQELGAGRVLGSLWEATWPWALASDRGAEDQRRLLRQAVTWLANRRPAAWVTSGRGSYALSAVRDGNASIELFAGVSGLSLGESDGSPAITAVRLVVEPVHSQSTQPATTTRTANTPRVSAPAWNVPLSRGPTGWIGILPDAGASRSSLAAGEYEARFEATVETPAGGVRPPQREVLSARARFQIADVDREMLAPTADLALLEDLAAAAASSGGRFERIDRLATVLDELTATDRRRRVERIVTLDPVATRPQWLFAVFVGALTLEWLLRRRAGVV